MCCAFALYEFAGHMGQSIVAVDYASARKKEEEKGYFDK